MGTWGAGSFENDDAADWAAEFCEIRDEELLSEALTRAAEAEAGEYLEAPDASVALAAAEIVAALNGAPHPQLPEEVGEYVPNLRTKAGPELTSLALRAVGRVKADSELKDLWDESGEALEWRAAVDDLEARLGSRR
jgi:hypothetical protein